MKRRKDNITSGNYRSALLYERINKVLEVSMKERLLRQFYPYSTLKDLGMDDVKRTLTIIADGFTTFDEKLKNFVNNVLVEFDAFVGRTLVEPTLEDTIEEKVGGGPHGYGDPADTTIRDEENYLFPRMIWRKIRFDKCYEVTERYYDCVNKFNSDEVQDCNTEEKEMFACKEEYYHPEKIDEVEKECIDEYVKARSKFRETGNEEDLWKIKMLMLEPRYDILREYQKNKMSEKDLSKLKPEQAPRVKFW